MPWSCFLWKTNRSSEKSSRSFNFAKRNLSLRTQLLLQCFQSSWLRPSWLFTFIHAWWPSWWPCLSWTSTTYLYFWKSTFSLWFNANVFKCAVTTTSRPNIGQFWIFTGLISLLSTEAKIYCILFGVKSLGISVIFLKSPVTYIAKTIRGRTSNI